MPGEISAFFDGIASAADIFAGGGTLLALLAFFVEFVRGRSETRSFRPAAGWLASILGLFAFVGTTIALHQRGVSPLQAEGAFLGVVAAISLLMVFLGAGTAILTPSADRNKWLGIAGAVETTVQRCDAEDNFVRANQIPLGFDVSNELPWSGENDWSKVSDLGSASLPAASVAVLAGASGSGKSIELRGHVLEICRRAKHSRKPRKLAVYVPMRGVAPAESEMTQDFMADLLLKALSAGNQSLVEWARRYLGGEVTGPSCLFVFDLDGELSRPQEEAFFQALRNFMRHRDRDRAIVAVREAFPDGQPVLVPRPPTPRQVKELLRKQGIADPAAKDLPETMVSRVLTSPAMIMHVLSANATTSSLSDLLDAFVDTRLNRHASPNGDVDTLRLKAERVAFELVFNPGATPHPDDELRLSAAQLGRFEQGAFQFRFADLRVHLAAAHLGRTMPAISLETLVSNDETRAVTVEALQRDVGGFKTRFISLVDAEVRSMVPFLMQDDTQLPPTGSFTWSPVVFHALTVLRRCSPDPRAWLTEHLRGSVDFLVWRSFFSGGRHNREASLTLLPLASQERVLALYRQAVSLRYDERTVSLVALHLRWPPGVSPQVGLHDRAVMIFHALKAWSKGQFLPEREAIVEHSLLLSMLRGFVNICCVSAAGVAVMLLAWATNAISVQTASVQSGLALAIAYIAWKLRLGESRLSDFWARITFRVAQVVVAVCGFFLLLLTFSIVGNLVPPRPSSLLLNLVYLWAFSWPIAMAVQVLIDPMGQRRWLLPQRVIGELRSRRTEWSRYSDLLDLKVGHMRSGWRRLVLVVFALVVGILAVDLPIEDQTEKNWESLGFVVAFIGVMIAARLPRGRRAHEPEEVIGKKVFSGEMTEEEMLLHLRQHAEQGNSEITRLLKTLAAAPPGALGRCKRVLESLDNLLEFLERTMPDPPPSSAGKPAAIKPGAWQHAPGTCLTALLDWAIAFDRGHRGVLVELANTEGSRALLSRAIGSADARLIGP